MLGQGRKTYIHDPEAWWERGRWDSETRRRSRGHTAEHDPANVDFAISDFRLVVGFRLCVCRRASALINERRFPVFKKKRKNMKFKNK